MRQYRPISFQIASIDSLGQGVSKIGERITFIPKTLPGEEGEALTQAEKKGVAFASLSRLSKNSPERIEPVCPHFADCPSCHFLHTGYEQELQFKKESFQNLFRKLPLPDLKVVGAPHRLGYRNRIQLHYDTKIGKMGMLDARSNQIVPVPSCMIGNESVLTKLRELYHNSLWLSLVPKNSLKGHVEIYEHGGEIQLNWNCPYAQGGFTQVFETMNEKLRIEILDWFNEKPGSIIDLFAGNGNLTNKLPYSGRLCVDIYSEAKSSEFFSQSLYDQNALKNVQHEILTRKLSSENLILDPPRSGLSNLEDWLNVLSPKRVAYISCDPHTMIRDLQKVSGYHLTRAVLLDFFPSTYHFESLIFLERK